MPRTPGGVPMRPSVPGMDPGGDYQTDQQRERMINDEDDAMTAQQARDRGLMSDRDFQDFNRDYDEYKKICGEQASVPQWNGRNREEYCRGLSRRMNRDRRCIDLRSASLKKYPQIAPKRHGNEISKREQGWRRDAGSWSDRCREDKNSAWRIAPTFFALLTPAPAHAQGDICSGARTGLEHTLNILKTLKAKNDAQIKSLLETETGCHQQGSRISHKIASLAQALSCQAQADASQINSQMHDLGGRCETLFRKIFDLQLDLHGKFLFFQGGLKSADQWEQQNPELRQACGSEVGATSGLLNEFEALGKSITGAEDRAWDGEVNYGRFKDMAGQLFNVTSDRNTGCGELAGKLATTFASALSPGKASPAQAPAGTHPRDASTITGKIRNDQLSTHGRTHGTGKDLKTNPETSAQPGTRGGGGPRGLPLLRSQPQTSEAGTVTGSSSQAQTQSAAQAGAPGRAPASLKDSPLAEFSKPLDGSDKPAISVGIVGTHSLDELGLSGEPGAAATGEQCPYKPGVAECKDKPLLEKLGLVTGDSVQSSGSVAEPTPGSPEAADLFGRVKARYRKEWRGMRP